MNHSVNMTKMTAVRGERLRLGSISLHQVGADYGLMRPTLCFSPALKQRMAFKCLSDQEKIFFKELHFLACKKSYEIKNISVQKASL